MKVLLSTDSYKTQSGESDIFYGFIKTPIYCYWRIYDIKKKKISNGFLYKDTLIWDASDYVPVAVGNQIPSLFSASAYAGGDCGGNYAKMVAPSWVDDKRLFYQQGSNELEKASEFVIKGEWVDAATEWQKVFARNKRKLSAKAAFNLALASEMLGKFDLALEWLRKASNYYPLPEISSYRAIIEDRISNISK